jgi:hypothetical protein
LNPSSRRAAADHSMVAAPEVVGKPIRLMAMGILTH